MVKLDITETCRRATLSTENYLDIFHQKRYPEEIRIHTHTDTIVLTQFQCIELIEQLVLTLRRSMELLQ